MVVGNKVHAHDVLFRLAAGCFAAWVVAAVATSPTTHLRPPWWPTFLLVGALTAMAMLLGGFKSLRLYLRQRSR